ncbi:response regulator [Desulfobacterales bacterium HSG16]|nr:response regulator [Desulfobacterales bacterium HSG16]
MEEKLNRQRILIVDDTPKNIDVLGGILSNYKRIVALNGEKALKKAMSDNPPDLILLDIMMPGMDGYEVCRRLKADPATKHIPVIFITAKSEMEDETKGLEMGAADYITKPISPSVVKARVKTHLSLKLAEEDLANQNILLEKEVGKYSKELLLTRNAMIDSLSSLGETRDIETSGHIQRTKNYVRMLADHLQKQGVYQNELNDSMIELLYQTAPLHDIGKICVLDRILLKPDTLTTEEIEEIKKHTIYGQKAIMKIEEDIGSDDFLRIARQMAYSHHEKWDGSGYPQGLKGKDIPIAGRLMAIAGVYDALISRRVYKEPIPHSKSVEIISEVSNREFDPNMIDAFLDLQEDFREIALEFADCDKQRENLQK